jgi:L-aminopeptidase/D-esterase-like protein
VKHDHTALDAITDVPGIKVGHWSDRRAATGCTVVLCPPEGAVAGVDVRGAAPGSRDTELLRPGKLVDRVNAVLLSGGSVFGLDAAGGVLRWLEEQNFGYEYGGGRIPIVPAAILFDLGIGSSKVRPNSDAGYRAAAAAKGGHVEQGSVGAGTGATIAKAAGMARSLKGGVGTACERGPNGLLAGALAAVNCGGDVIDPGSGRQIAGPRAEDGRGMVDGWDLVRRGMTPQPSPVEHTTLVVIATNAALTKEWANRVATIGHDGLARCIRPAHTMGDGDTVFALATGDVSVEEPAAYRALEAIAARAVERAVIRGVLCATGLAGVPSAQEWTTG